MADRLPEGWHWVDSSDKKQGAVDPDGGAWSRAQAHNQAARDAGFRSNYHEKKARREYRELEAQNPRQRAIDDQRARETAEARGRRFGRKERADYDSKRVAMMFGRDAETRSTARNTFLWLTGRTDRPDYGY